MDAKETVKQGLQARKDVRAAEARTEQLREDLTAANDARFREHMSHRQAKLAWQSERESLICTVYRCRYTIRHLREEKEALIRREREAQQRRVLFSAIKSVGVIALLLITRDLGLIVSWLASSMLALAVTHLLFTVVALVRNK